MRLLLALTLAIAASVPAAEHIQSRGSTLSNFFLKLARSNRGEKNEKGEPLQCRIVYFGGSITAGAGASKPELCYRSLLTKHLKELYPNAQLIETNAAIGGTGSWLGAFRIRSDIFDHWVPGDLVIVEFAVNDGGAPEQQVYASMEGIVRQLRERYPQGEILFLYTLVKDHLEAFKKGELPSRMQWHEKIAEHYGIPSVNMAMYAAQKILAGELTMEEFAKDNVHPTDRGYALYMEALRPGIDQCVAAGERATELVKYPLPGKKFSERCMDRAKMVPYERAQFDDKWQVGQDSPVDKFLHVLASDVPGAELTVRFKGDSIGYYDAIGPDTGDLEVSIDGGPWQPKPNWDQWCTGYRAHCRTIKEGLDPAVEHTVKIRIAEKQPEKSKGRFFRPAFLLVNGEFIAEDPYKGLSPLEKIDKIYSGIMPVKYTPPADRWKHIPEAMKRLQEGGALRIVMLGDSIVGDTSSSQWQLLLERMYPKCKVEKILSNRGSTGCWWYKDENRVQDYVLKHKPDLLMIGGISNRDDTEAIREVIKQVRAALPAVEVALMTPVFGSVDPRKDKDSTFEVDPNGTSYRSRLWKLAQDEKCEFIDMTGPWGQYIRESGKALGYYKRDRVHANERGFQILGRILEKYFGPK